jgi:hypothetical protein
VEVDGDQIIVMRRLPADHSGQIFIGLYRQSDLDAYTFALGPCGFSLSGGRWVLAGPLDAPSTVSVQIANDQILDVIVTHRGWLCVTPALTNTSVARVSIFSANGSTVAEIQMPFHGHDGLQARNSQ